MVLIEELRPFITKRKIRFNPLRHGCSPLYLLHIFRTSFYKNTSEGLLLRVPKAIVENLASKYIKLPITDDEVFESAELFYAKHCFPLCIDTADSTQNSRKKA